jgi:hypothetical protein
VRVRVEVRGRGSGGSQVLGGVPTRRGGPLQLAGGLSPNFSGALAGGLPPIFCLASGSPVWCFVWGFRFGMSGGGHASKALTHPHAEAGDFPPGGRTIVKFLTGLFRSGFGFCLWVSICSPGGAGGFFLCWLACLAVPVGPPAAFGPLALASRFVFVWAASFGA